MDPAGSRTGALSLTGGKAAIIASPVVAVLVPEILAPAGDEECLRAAVGAGADAVYFGLQTGFNARAKAANFGVADLPRVFDFLHERGVKGYVTFNTLVYDSELAAAAECLAAIARAGADAILVQDLGIARLAHSLAPTLPLHASTQMTVSSAEAAAIAKELGVVRIVLPRELSIDDIRQLRLHTDLELECFVHGALCVSYSGQCLTSEVWGQRSANRGQCAQSCRLPYDLIVDGRTHDLGIEKYLLSPKDLAAHHLIGQLIEAGVGCFKIEGRYKGPEYVAATVEKYRQVRDAILDGKPGTLAAADLEDLAFTYSRGFSAGWLAGDDHQELSHGLYPGHRGLRVGSVVEVRGYSVWVRLDTAAPALKPGDWMVFDQGNPEGDEPRGGIFSIGPTTRDVVELRFGEPGPDLRLVRPGNGLWKSHDSAVKKRLLRYMTAERRVPIDLTVRGALGEPLHLAGHDDFGRSAEVTSSVALEQADAQPLTSALLREKIGALGDTRYALRRFDVHLADRLAIPPRELKALRRRLIASLEAQPIARHTHAVTALDWAQLELGREGNDLGTPLHRLQPSNESPAELVPLCRTLDQVDAVLALGVPEVILDFMELVGLRRAVESCRAAGARVIIATMRIQKPGEEPIDVRFANLEPDGVLARHLGAVHFFRAHLGNRFQLYGDFSLNCTNAITGRTLLGMGLTALTPAYDLNIEQVRTLASELPAERLEITLHQHLPLYHTEYCLYAHNLSQGRDFRDCGRPCETHQVKLRDPKGLEHPVLVDVGCRNTVFNAHAQSAATHFDELRHAGVRRFRVEFVWESAAETTRVWRAYERLAHGAMNAATTVRKLGTLERYGVTTGTLAVVRNKALPVVGSAPL